MSRISFQRDGWQEGGLSDGTSEGCKPSSLYTGPKCTCTQPGTQLKIDGELYTAISIITDAGCPEHGMCNRSPGRVTVSEARRVVADMKGKDKR
jgi:hypothetical protein